MSPATTDKIIAEKNQGCEMGEATIRTVDPIVPIKLITATRGKMTRAEPIAALYEKGRRVSRWCVPRT